MSSPSTVENLGPPGALPPDNRRVSRKLRDTSRLVGILRLPLVVGVLAAIGLVVFLPVRFPSAVNTFATIIPAQKWVLARASDGKLIECLFNYKSGLNEGYRVSTFNPGSSIYFTLHPKVQSGQPITAGDTVGNVYSSEVQERLIALQGQLAAARSLLVVTSTGQKAAVVNEAAQRLQFAQRRSTEHQRIEQRTQKLFAEHLIAEGESDRVQNEASVLRDEITIAAANLEAARTGAKPEQLGLVNANIAALQSELEAVERRADTHTVTAPISGIVTPNYSSDTLLTIATPECIAILPVNWSDYRRVSASPRPRLSITGLAPTTQYGTIIAMNRQLHVLHGHEVFLVTAVLDSPSPAIMPGMLVRCRIDCAPVTAVQYGRQMYVALTASQPLLGGF